MSFFTTEPRAKNVSRIKKILNDKWMNVSMKFEEINDHLVCNYLLINICIVSASYEVATGYDGRYLTWQRVY